MLTIDGPWINPWHAVLVAAVLFCSVMQLLLTRSDPDSPASCSATICCSAACACA